MSEPSGWRKRAISLERERDDFKSKWFKSNEQLREAWADRDVLKREVEGLKIAESGYYDQIQEKDAEIARLLSLLGTERDSFGKHETELMGEVERLRGALENSFETLTELVRTMDDDHWHADQIKDSCEKAKSALGQEEKS